MAGPARRGADDVALARLIVDWLVDHACVSRQHVFASGFSNGARMSLRLGCEAADLFAGIAPGAGTSSFEPPCLPSRPISYLGFSGTEDHLVSRVAGWEMFAQLNNCTTVTRPTFTSATTRCFAYDGCAADTFVEFCVAIGMRHEWMGHIRPSPNTDPGAVPYDLQPTDLDFSWYIFNRFSTLLPPPEMSDTAAEFIAAHTPAAGGADDSISVTGAVAAAADLVVGNKGSSLLITMLVSAALGALGGYKLGGALGRSSKGARYTSVEGGD